MKNWARNKSFFFRVLWKALPYVISTGAGFCFYFLGHSVGNSLRSLFINMASALFAIPLAFLAYQSVDSLAHRKLNVELWEYTKMVVDNEIVPLLRNFARLVLPFRRIQSLTNDELNNILSMNVEEITGMLCENRHLGFHVWKSWQSSAKQVEKLLHNPLILKVLSDDQMLPIVAITKSLVTFERLLERNYSDFFTETDEKPDVSLKLHVSSETDGEKGKVRCLLLSDIGGGRFVVEDSGLFSRSRIASLLKVYSVSDEAASPLAYLVRGVLGGIGDWAAKTGSGFILDPRLFRGAAIKHNHASKTISQEPNEE